jgi:hypothetical protein
MYMLCFSALCNVLMCLYVNVLNYLLQIDRSVDSLCLMMYMDVRFDLYTYA